MILEMPEEKLQRLEEVPRESSYSQNSLDDAYSSSDSEFFDPLDDDDDEYDYVALNDEDEDDDDDDDVDHLDNSHCLSVDDSNSTKDALHELRDKVEDAIINKSIFGKKYTDISEDLEDVKIWGVPLLPSKGHEGTDIVLVKFLKAKHNVVSEAFRMLRKTMKWRRELRMDESFDKEFEDGLESMWNMQGKDFEGRPVCYCMLGEFKDNRGLRDNEYMELNEQSSNYMRWRLLCLERAVREIDFREGEPNSIIQIIDLKNAHSRAMKECNNSMNRKLMSLVHEYYPGLVHKHLFINVSVWYMAVNALNMKLITKKTKKKYCFVRSTRVIQTLAKLLPPEHIPVQYGGLLRENDDEFSTDDKVLEAYARGNYITRIKIPVKKVDITLTWDLTVVGFNVLYKEEFVPDDDCSYEVLIQDKKKMQSTIRNSFHIREPGSIIITIENATYTKRKVFYRHKLRPSIPFYLMCKPINRMD